MNNSSLTRRLLLMIVAYLLFSSASQAQNFPAAEEFQLILDKSVDQKKIFGTVMSIHQGTNSWTGSAGDLQDDSRYFIASTTKLYITAILLNLELQKKLNRSDKISKYLQPSVMRGLHIYKDHDYSNDITIRHLMSHTSGLPDYFLGKKSDEKSLYEDITSGKDQYWSFEEVIALSKTMKPKFAPGTPKKALYSDTNFQLLQKIIETQTGMSIDKVLQSMIFEPLHLKNTYLYLDSSDHTPVTMYFKKEKLDIPLSMTSFKADGGIVSTVDEHMIFLKAFFNGTFFPKSELEELYSWNKIFFPLQYGVGLMKFSMAGVPFNFYGHSGHSGAIIYYCPEKDAFIAGTVNQIHHPGLSYRLMIKLINKLP